MKKLLTLLTFLVLATPASAEEIPVLPDDMLTRYEAVHILSHGTAVLTRYGNKTCTVWKAGEKLFATAGHCSGAVSKSSQIKQMGDRWKNTNIKSLVYPINTEKDGGKTADWMLLNTSHVMEEMGALSLGCGDELKIGEPVAVGHYPAGLNFSVSFGHVMTMDVTSNRNNAVIAVDAAGAPGSSGAPVISLETGRVVGIVIEGIVSRFGAFAMGLESINNFDLCDYLEEEDVGEKINDTF